MTQAEINQLKFTVALINIFAESNNIQPKQAFNYLNKFEGMQFLGRHYKTLHTQSFEDVVETLSMVCKRNGGDLA